MKSHSYSIWIPFLFAARFLNRKQGSRISCALAKNIKRRIVLSKKTQNDRINKDNRMKTSSSKPFGSINNALRFYWLREREREKDEWEEKQRNNLLSHKTPPPICVSSSTLFDFRLTFYWLSIACENILCIHFFFFFFNSEFVLLSSNELIKWAYMTKRVRHACYKIDFV